MTYLISVLIRNMGLCKKRNMLQKLSTGKYFTHLDDDDRVVDGYFIKLVKHIEGLKDLPDIIAFDQICFVGEDTFIVKPDITLNLTLHTGPVKSEKDLKVYYRYPWQFHLFNERFKKVYRTESDSPDKINKPHMFDDVNFLKKIQLEKPNRMEYVNEILHEYHFEDPSKTISQMPKDVSILECGFALSVLVLVIDEIDNIIVTMLLKTIFVLFLILLGVRVTISYRLNLLQITKT